MPWIPVPHEVLQEAEVMPLVAQRIARAVAQHVRPDAAEVGALASLTDEVVDGLARHWLPTLGNEQPRQGIVAAGEVALDGAEFVAFDGLLGVERVL
jgi:hypothetical protein